MNQIFSEVRHGQSHWRLRLNLLLVAYLVIAVLGIALIRGVVDIADRYFEYSALGQLRGFCDPSLLHHRAALRESSSSIFSLTSLAKALPSFYR